MRCSTRWLKRPDRPLPDYVAEWLEGTCGAPPELADLLGAPLDAASQDKALGIVRSNTGLGSALETAHAVAFAAKLGAKLADDDVMQLYDHARKPVRKKEDDQ